MWELRKREQMRLTPRFWLGQRLSVCVWGHSLSKGTSKLLAQCRAHRKYFMKISYNDYPKFNFGHVVLDKYLVGNMGQVRGS